MVQLVGCLDLFVPPCPSLSCISDTTTNAIVARAKTPVAQTCALVAHICASLSAYRGAAMLFKLFDVLVAAAQQVPRLVGGFRCLASFNTHGAKRDGGTAVEWCAQCLASRSIARHYAVTIASRAAGQKSQYWAKAQKGEVVHDATPTIEPALDRASEAIVSASARAGTSS